LKVGIPKFRLRISPFILAPVRIETDVPCRSPEMISKKIKNGALPDARGPPKYDRLENGFGAHVFFSLFLEKCYAVTVKRSRLS